nr:hypothetical protein [Mycolicibacterium litorale]
MVVDRLAFGRVAVGGGIVLGRRSRRFLLARIVFGLGRLFRGTLVSRVIECVVGGDEVDDDVGGGAVGGGGGAVGVVAFAAQWVAGGDCGEGVVAAFAHGAGVVGADGVGHGLDALFECDAVGGVHPVATAAKASLRRSRMVRGSSGQTVWAMASTRCSNATPSGAYMRAQRVM